MQRSRSEIARALYVALAVGDRDKLDTLLHPNFVGEIAEGMPYGIGGRHEGAAAMRRNGWGLISRHFTVRAEAERFLDVGEDRLLVTGRYRGQGKHGGGSLDASFAHIITFDAERVIGLEQHTDTALWHAAAASS